jgi:hypothetical protein
MLLRYLSTFWLPSFNTWKKPLELGLHLTHLAFSNILLRCLSLLRAERLKGEGRIEASVLSREVETLALVVEAYGAGSVTDVTPKYHC